jgi:hypothetical protein
LDKKIDAAAENLDDKISGATSEVVKLSYLNSAGAAAQEVVDCAMGSLHSIGMPMYRMTDMRSVPPFALLVRLSIMMMSHRRLIAVQLP